MPPITETSVDEYSFSQHFILQEASFGWPCFIKILRTNEWKIRILAVQNLVDSPPCVVWTQMGLNPFTYRSLDILTMKVLKNKINFHLHPHPRPPNTSLAVPRTPFLSEMLKFFLWLPFIQIISYHVLPTHLFYSFNSLVKQGLLWRQYHQL